MAKKKLYTLLVGINQYIEKIDRAKGCTFPPLKGTINDVNALHNYLKTEEEYEYIPLQLTDKNATKANIVKGFKEHLAKATANDIALFYFSGHGIQEEADTSIWKEETDGLLESIVCYNGEGNNFVLADKELRYLIHQMNTDEVITIFDCCHSGENTRNGYFANAEIRERKVDCILPQRQWSDFIFSKTLSKEAFHKHAITELLPEGNHIHMAACEPDESAMEVGGSGIFTTVLIKLLQLNSGSITYFNLVNQIRHYLRHSFEQKPKIYAPYPDKGLKFHTFLNKKAPKSAIKGNVIYNREVGWILDMGHLYNIQVGTNIQLTNHDGQVYNAIIKRVQLDRSILEFETEQPPKNQSLSADISNSAKEKLNLYINDTDKDYNFNRKLFFKISEACPQVIFSDQKEEADIIICIENGWLSIQDNEFLDRPLTRIFDKNRSNTLLIFPKYLNHIARWTSIKKLKNPYSWTFKSCPLEVTFYENGNKERPQLINIENPDAPLELYPNILTSGIRHGIFSMSIKSNAQQKLYIGTIFLAHNFSATHRLMNPSVKIIHPEEKITLFKQREGKIPFSIKDDSIEYNFPYRSDFIKIIISTNDFDIERLRQDKLPAPMTWNEYINSADRVDPKPLRSSTRASDDWQVYTLALKTINPFYNQLSPSKIEQLKKVPEMMTFVEKVF